MITLFNLYRLYRRVYLTRMAAARMAWRVWNEGF